VTPRRQAVAALVAQLLAAAAALLLSTRGWQTVRIARQRPFADVVVGVSGRTLDGSITALALVALAGVVAIPATRGNAQRVVGVLVLLAGVALAWRAGLGMSALSARRAVALAATRGNAVGIDAASPVRVSVHVVWPVLSIACGAVICVAGALFAVRAGSWSLLSSKYEAPTAPPGDVSLWTALDRGEDPTARTEP
jgi:uncharacterized membrane protein (TIGR02234 family)